MNGVAKPQRNSDHRAGEYSQSPIQCRILLRVLIDGILTNGLLGYTNQTHQARGQRLSVDTHKTLPVSSGTPYRHESLLILIQEPDGSFVGLSSVKRLSEDAGNAFRTPQIVKLK